MEERAVMASLDPGVIVANPLKQCLFLHVQELIKVFQTVSL